MYIVVKTNKNLDNLIKELLINDISVEVRKHKSLTFIDANLKEYGYGAYIDFTFKCLRIHSFKNGNVEILINFEDLETVYDLD